MKTFNKWSLSKLGVLSNVSLMLASLVKSKQGGLPQQGDLPKQDDLPIKHEITESKAGHPVESTQRARTLNDVVKRQAIIQQSIESDNATTPAEALYKPLQDVRVPIQRANASIQRWSAHAPKSPNKSPNKPARMSRGAKNRAYT